MYWRSHICAWRGSGVGIRGGPWTKLHTLMSTSMWATCLHSGCPPSSCVSSLLLYQAATFPFTLSFMLCHLAALTFFHFHQCSGLLQAIVQIWQADAPAFEILPPLRMLFGLLIVASTPCMASHMLTSASVCATFPLLLFFWMIPYSSPSLFANLTNHFYLEPSVLLDPLPETLLTPSFLCQQLFFHNPDPTPLPQEASLSLRRLSAASIEHCDLNGLNKKKCTLCSKPSGDREFQGWFRCW